MEDWIKKAVYEMISIAPTQDEKCYPAKFGNVSICNNKDGQCILFDKKCNNVQG